MSETPRHDDRITRGETGAAGTAFSEDSPGSYRALPPWQEYFRPVVTSTMDWAREVAAGAERSVDAFRVRTERQTAGRGRRGSRWRDAPGSSLLTTVAIRRGGRFDPGDPNPATIALRAGNAVADLVTELGVPGVTIKWPNDILIRDRKLCGILVEADPRWFYVGIGLNVGPVAGESDQEGAGPAAEARLTAGGRAGAIDPSADGSSPNGSHPDSAGFGMPPVSLTQLLHRTVPLALPLSLLDEYLRAALTDLAWRDQINRRLAWRGAMVCLEAEGRDTLEGHLLEVHETGGIRIRQTDGTTITAMAGTLRRRDEDQSPSRLR
jgi:biotin-(acetyl-CoA carboxylase) ligase